MRTHTHMRTRTHRDNTTKTKNTFRLKPETQHSVHIPSTKTGRTFFFFCSHFDCPTLQVIRLGMFGSETTPDVSQKVDREGAPGTHAKGLTSKSILDINGGGGGWYERHFGHLAREKCHLCDGKH